MLTLDEIEPGTRVTHKNTGLRYSVVDVGEDEVLLSPEQSDLQDLVVPVGLFCAEFIATDRYSAGRGRGRRPAAPGAPSPAARAPVGPKCRGRIKKMVRERGFGFIRGDDGKEVFFHRSGLNGAEYDILSEGDTVEYVVQEGARGPRAEHVRAVADAKAAAPTP
ncbi:MAG TPA: cold shock domain-containing protein [Myxococcota bacterium]|jgi:CspA family cold shock protein|nr:cold shock domain-containing protein [Myxococcota bacterium]